MYPWFKIQHKPVQSNNNGLEKGARICLLMSCCLGHLKLKLEERGSDRMIILSLTNNGLGTSDVSSLTIIFKTPFDSTLLLVEEESAK